MGQREHIKIGAAANRSGPENLFPAQPVFHIVVCGGFKFINERRKVCFAVFALERGFENQVSQFRVFRKQTAVGIGCKNVFVVCTFRSVLSVVAIAFEYFAERFYSRRR